MTTETTTTQFNSSENHGIKTAETHAPNTGRRMSGKRFVAMALMLVATASLLAACLSPEQTLGQELINESRAAYNRAPLSNMNQATTKAQAWAEHLAQRDTGLSNGHSNLKSGYSGTCWLELGENVGYVSGGSLEQAVRTAQPAFMKSVPHRTNILNRRYTHVGVGVAKAQSGAVYVVQEFVKAC